MGWKRDPTIVNSIKKKNPTFCDTNVISFQEYRLNCILRIGFPCNHGLVNFF